ncbi:MAG: TraB/GumN family protein [Saprospiraceae bacterium]
MLYQLTTKHTDKTSYLFGTMHLQNEAAFTYKEQILAKINECEAFATEFKLDEADEEKTTRYMNLPPGIFLETLLSKKKFAQIDAFLKSNLRIPLMAFNQSKPLVITNLITTSIFQQDMELALDIYLYQYAKMQGKELLGIETFDEQLEILEKIPLELQVKSLKDLIKNFDQHRLEMNEISQLYAEGKTKELYKLAKKSAKGFRRIMLYNRNTIMSERIAKLITEKSICVAIGAGHLEGKRGVIKGLKAFGVEVKKIED